MNSFDLAKEMIRTIAIRYQAKFEPSSVELWAKELSAYSQAELNTAYQRFKSEYENLPYQFAVSAGLIKQLKPKLTTATVEERLYASMDDKDPWKFLANISVKLKELADQGNMFDRSLSAADLEFRVKNIAKRFVEWQQNVERGFVQKEPERPRIEYKPEGVRRPNPFRGMDFPKTREEMEQRLRSLPDANTGQRPA